MGLTYRSTKREALQDLFAIDKTEDQFVIALTGNPNTGKSTVFNALTGLHQHTGNWPGKTVTNARGEFKTKEHDYVLVDLPGTYSLFATSEEELVARDFICFGQPDAVVVVTDATALERNLHLAFQIMELTTRVILCINLIDEAEKKGIVVDRRAIEQELGVPVVLTSARSKLGLDELTTTLDQIINNNYPFDYQPLTYNEETERHIHQLLPLLANNYKNLNPRWLALRLIDGNESIYQSMNRYLSPEEADELIQIEKTLPRSLAKDEIRDHLTEISYAKAEEIKRNYVYLLDKQQLARERDLKIDTWITSKRFGIPLMLLLLLGILWLTIAGANIPSELLSNFFAFLGRYISHFLTAIHPPQWLYELLLNGVYQTLANVISVMLPPMAIFFPLFTALEDLGYLPRVAFNLDHLFKKACAHGKQCLTMCMGFGCNAAGIIGCRIIESPREKLIAILTNNFMICNGRFPTIIAIASVLLLNVDLGPINGTLASALVVGLIVILGVFITLGVSYLLSKTILKGVPSSFTLELPPYRTPQLGRILYTSIIDRTLFVLGRAVMIAIPAGIMIWCLNHLYVNDLSLLTHIANFLNPFATLIGLDGFILMAFILGIPANEIVIPILLMSYLSSGVMVEFDSILSLSQILTEHGWTLLTGINVLLFTLCHWPCSTTLMTIKKETGGYKWAILAFLIPTLIGFLLCFINTLIFQLFGWV